jgi:U3 small nucleolar ribonucleoprotein component
VIADVGAITMEEAIPVTANDASMLAPEEVYEKKRGEIKVSVTYVIKDVYSCAQTIGCY